MNKYQKALDNLVRVSCPKKVSCIECDIGKICNCVSKEHINTLQKLVNETILKKPEHEADGCYNSKLVVCPNCKTRYEIAYVEFEYCPKCGQAIDWSDEK